jgi:hypothetical protein
MTAEHLYWATTILLWVIMGVNFYQARQARKVQKFYRAATDYHTSLTSALREAVYVAVSSARVHLQGHKDETHHLVAATQKFWNEYLGLEKHKVGYDRQRKLHKLGE